jgi:mono/diheme cytochrome c family protein
LTHKKGKTSMQVKVTIGTIAFMLMMIIFGYAALREPARLERYTEAEMARSIETGAHLFQQNCTNCHGENGLAQVCVDPATGEEIGCVGLPLSSNLLLCGDVSLRMDAMNWKGSKEAFIQSTIASGRPGTQMPTWSEQFGGPMRPDQVRNVANFVLNFETEELCSQPIITFDWAESVGDFLAEQEPGDAAHGKELFVSYGCSGCHGVPDEGTPASVGPDLTNIAEDGALRVEGQTAEQYIYTSVLHPNDFIAPECPNGPCTGPPSAMRQTYALDMGSSPQDLADILSYLLGE